MKQIVIFLVKWLIIFFVASVIIFIAVRMMPSTPVDKWLNAYHLAHTEENVAFVTHKMGLDQPLIIQYLTWIRNFLRGDWGVSLVSGENIRERFMAKMPYSGSFSYFNVFINKTAWMYRIVIHHLLFSLLYESNLPAKSKVEQRSRGSLTGRFSAADW